MRPENIASAVDPKNFHPFRLRMSNGEEYEVRHPEQVIVGRSTVTVGIHRRNGLKIFEKVYTIGLLHVVSIIPIEETEVK